MSEAVLQYTVVMSPGYSYTYFLLEREGPPAELGFFAAYPSPISGGTAVVPENDITLTQGEVILADDGSYTKVTTVKNNAPFNWVQANVYFVYV